MLGHALEAAGAGAAPRRAWALAELEGSSDDEEGGEDEEGARGAGAAAAASISRWWQGVDGDGDDGDADDEGGGGGASERGAAISECVDCAVGLAQAPECTAPLLSATVARLREALAALEASGVRGAAARDAATLLGAAGKLAPLLAAQPGELAGLVGLLRGVARCCTEQRMGERGGAGLRLQAASMVALGCALRASGSGGDGGGDSGA